MTRGLLVFACVALILSVAGAACGPREGDVADPNSPQAQATNVRRTEVAAVQIIIANNSTPTSTVASTAVAPPSCQAQGAIWWYEARLHLGETRTVQGVVVATRPAPAGLAMLEIGQPYPDPSGLAVLMRPTQPSGATLEGKSVCVAGRIAMVEGRLAIQLPDPATLRVLN